MNKIVKQEKHESTFDYMRVIGVIGVIVIHVCAMQWSKINIYSHQWVVIHIYDMFVKFSVPLFFMISGRFFLDLRKEISIKKIVKKISHIIVVFIFWSLVYTLLNIFRTIMLGNQLKDNLNWIFVEFFSGEYHMWFLYAIIGLYLITPILRKIVEDKKLTQYFLLLFIIFGIFWPVLEQIPKLGILFTTVGNEMLFHLTIGYSGYYILGYYIYKYPLNKKYLNILYILGVIGIFMSITLTLISSCKAGNANEELAAYLTPNVAFTSIAVYQFILNKFNNKKPKQIVSLISKYSLGCYLIHPLILWFFEFIGFVPTVFITELSIPIITLITLLLSLFFSWVISNIPYLREVI